MGFSFIVTCSFMTGFMNIDIITITSYLVFKCLTIHPVLDSKDVITLNSATISNSQQGSCFHDKRTTKSLRLEFLHCSQILFSYLSTLNHSLGSSPRICRVHIHKMSRIKLHDIRAYQITTQMAIYQRIFTGCNSCIDRTVFITCMQ